MPPFAFALADSGETLDLDIYSNIGRSMWWDSVSAKDVRRTLRQSKATTINVRINSEGGDVLDAGDIFDQLKVHSARKVIRVGGLAASAASYIMMAGDEIVLSPTAWVMIHNPWGGLSGEAEDLRHWASILDKMREQMADVYAKRSGQPRAKVLEMMAAETWMTATEAVALGFADRVDEGEGSAATARAKARGAFAAASVRDFTNVPPDVRQRAEAARKELSQATPPATAARTEESMSQPTATLAALAVILGLTEDAHPDKVVAKAKDRIKLADALESETGADGDAAIGVVKAWKLSHEALPAARAKLEAAEKQQASNDLEALLDGGRSGSLKHMDGEHAGTPVWADGKPRLTKALADGLRAQVLAGDMTLKGARAFVQAMPPVVALSGAPPVQGATSSHNGKRYEQLSSPERAALAKESPETFAILREDWLARGEPASDN